MFCSKSFVMVRSFSCIARLKQWRNKRKRLATLDQAKAAAENIQNQSANTLRKSEQLINRARFMSVFLVPLALVVLVVVCWLAFHRAAP